MYFFLIFLVDREIDMGHSVVVLLVLLLLVLNIVRVDRVEANLLVVLSINNVYDYLHIASRSVQKISITKAFSHSSVLPSHLPA